MSATAAAGTRLRRGSANSALGRLVCYNRKAVYAGACREALTDDTCLLGTYYLSATGRSCTLKVPKNIPISDE